MQFFSIHVKPQTHKMVKHTQKICQQQQTNSLSVFDHFVGLPLKGLISCSKLTYQFLLFVIIFLYTGKENIQLLVLTGPLYSNLPFPHFFFIYNGNQKD